MANGSKLMFSQLNGGRNQFWLAIGSMFGLGASLTPGAVIHGTGETQLQFVESARESLETNWLTDLADGSPPAYGVTTGGRDCFKRTFRRDWAEAWSDVFAELLHQVSLQSPLGRA